MEEKEFKSGSSCSDSTLLTPRESFEKYFKQYMSQIDNVKEEEPKDFTEGDELMDLAEFIKTHEKNINDKEDAIVFMKKVILATVDKIAEYKDKIRVSKEIIEETKEKIIDII